MNPQYDSMIVLLIALTASIFTWKMVKDFYSTKFHKIFAHLIAVTTGSFMFLSSMLLFVPKNYQRGAGAEVELSFSSLAIVIVMVIVIYVFFKYLPGTKKEE